MYHWHTLKVNPFCSGKEFKTTMAPGHSYGYATLQNKSPHADDLFYDNGLTNNLKTICTVNIYQVQKNFLVGLSIGGVFLRNKGFSLILIMLLILCAIKCHIILLRCHRHVLTIAL